MYLMYLLTLTCIISEIWEFVFLHSFYLKLWLPGFSELGQLCCFLRFASVAKKELNLITYVWIKVGLLSSLSCISCLTFSLDFEVFEFAVKTEKNKITAKLMK